MEPLVQCPGDPRASAKAYLMNRMLPKEIREFEEHVALCPSCRETLESVRAEIPVSFVHQTEDGPVHLWASPDEAGGWKARMWGHQLAGARRFPDVAEANRHLRESFARMFPGHRCSGGCGYLEEAAQEHAAERMQFGDYLE